MGMQVSPGISISEIDLTTGIPNVSSTTGALAGHFRWGPVQKAVLISDENGLVNTFREPDANTFVDFFTGANFHANSQTDWGKNISTLAIRKLDQSDTRSAVRIILDGDHAGDHITVEALEINDTVAAFVATADMTHRDATLVVAAAGALDGLGEFFLRLGFGDLREIRKDFEAGSRGEWTECFECHG